MSFVDHVSLAVPDRRGKLAFPRTYIPYLDSIAQPTLDPAPVSGDLTRANTRVNARPWNSAREARDVLVLGASAVRCALRKSAPINIGRSFGDAS
jgi:hypothetical protein